VIPDTEASARAAEVRRILVCTGKVYTDLVAAAPRASRSDIAICRLEQLYPVPMRDLRAMLDGYPNADEIVWVQEEPENMGAWTFVRGELVDKMLREVTLAARARSASPATGSASVHEIEQRQLLDRAFAGIV
jgi:2-oxoglutarate dehydrogenase complex dehydrogenase (E1) component-like enzyme